jgi:hypothetical protein
MVFFLYFFSSVSKLFPLLFCVCWRLLFIGKMLLGPQNWSLNFFFWKFWFFLIFLDFSYQHRLEWGKSMIFKNNALKVELILKIFENLNSFETMLKMLKWRKYIKKHIFWIFVVFLYFWIFLKIHQNMGQKLDSNIYKEF